MNNYDKIMEYHSKEIIYILLILSSNLSFYNNDELIALSEDIEGRIEVLFEENNLIEFKNLLPIKDIDIEIFKEIKEKTMSLYKPQWYKALIINSKKIKEIRELSKNLLNRLSISYVEPFEYSDKNLNIDW